MNRYLLKLAKQTQNQENPEGLRPHQVEALDKLEKNKGLILAHEVGAGKSLVFLTAAKRALDRDKDKDALIIAPASLVTNVDNELKKHKIKLDRKRLQVMSYEKANNMADELGKHKYSIAISDESQKLRNADTQRSKAITDIFSRADQRILATATPNFNHAADISPLINIAAGYEALPTKRKDFENRYLRKIYKDQGFIDKMLGKPKEEQQVVIRKNELAELFKDHVHYYDPKTDESAKDKFPTMTEKIIGVDMSPEQLDYYKYAENKIPFILKMKIRHGLPLDRKEKAQVNSFSVGTRQTSNSYRHLMQDSDSAKFTPKIEKAVESLQEKMENDKNFRGLVYSNYLEAGVDEYARLLKKKGIKHGVFTGKLSKEEKDVVKNDFNAGKFPVLLVSSSGSEGLSLKGTKLVQLLDPHFNHKKLHQVIGRASRFESHEHLPKEERKVEVEHYLSTHPKSITGFRPNSIDVYLNKMGDDKDEVFDQIKKIMKENS